jgi:hypothetical protein
MKKRKSIRKHIVKLCKKPKQIGKTAWRHLKRWL